jgi:hypothetical protein
MTDFFDRLLARQRPLAEPGAVTRALPRVPTLFERSRAAEPEEIFLERTATSPPVVVAPPRSAVPFAPVPRSVTPPPATAAPIGRAETDPAGTGPAAVATAIVSPEPAPPALAPSAVVHPPMLPPPAAPRAESALSPAVAPSTAGPQLVAPAAPRVARAPSPSPTDPAVPLLAPAAEHRTRRAEPPGRTVQVHIGRIEVSASSDPEAKPERAQRRGPALTLDKYLGAEAAR